MKRAFPLLGLILYFLYTQSHPERISSSADQKKLTQVNAIVPALQVPSKVAAQRRPAQSVLTTSLSEIGKEVVKDKSIRVGKGLVLARNVGASPRAQYRPSFGKLVYEDKAFIYYLKQPQEHSLPVAFSPSRSKFYPISRILHVKKVSEELREELQKEGFQEYHYMQNIQLLFVESNNEDVLKTYEQLREKGLQVELEALTEPHKAL